MGASGKKLRGNGARHKQNSPAATAAIGDWGPLPHPRRVTNGQRFSPLKGRRRPFTIVRHTRAGEVVAVKDDGPRERLTLRAERLLATGPDARGVHYRFLGYRAGRRYSTFACVIALQPPRVILCLPEWHPARPVLLEASLVPPDASRPGCWLSCKADLGQPTAGALNLASFAIRGDPGRELCPAPAAVVPCAGTAAWPPRLGRGCGDVVIQIADPNQLAHTHAGVEVHLTGHAMLAPGGRAFLAMPGAETLTAYHDIVSANLTPNTTRVIIDADEHPLPIPVPVGRRRVGGEWWWRWWELSRDSGPVTPPAAACVT